MMTLTSISLMNFFIPFILKIIANILSKKTFVDREKSSPFECEFDPIISARIPFSIQFLLIAVALLIFDVEVALLIPMFKIMKFSSIYSWMYICFFFLFILLIGLYQEWNKGALNWPN